jgi:hypothetical protein
MAEPVWIADTSSIIWIKSSIPREARAGVFEALDRFVAAGRLMFPRQVLKELQRDTSGHPPDAACQWAMAAEARACATEPSLDEVKKILAEFTTSSTPRKTPAWTRPTPTCSRLP